MAAKTSSAAPELLITRTFDAPRALVFDVWTKPEHLAQWSAPHGFTVSHQDGELRPGGKWRACMRTPDGQDLWLGGEYREIVPPARLVFTHAWDDPSGTPGPQTIVTVELADEGTTTRMTFRQAFFTTVEERDGHQDGWAQCFERLTGYLAGLVA